MNSKTLNILQHLPVPAAQAPYTQEVDQLLHPLRKFTLLENGVQDSPITTVSDGKRFHIERFVFIGPDSGHQPIRLGIFAGIRGQDRHSPAAAVRFLHDLVASPELATGFHIYFYPVAYPHGFNNHQPGLGAGKDLFQLLWKDSPLPEPYLLERELAVIQFHGILSLLGLSNLSGVSLQLHGVWSSLQTTVVQPAVHAASRFLPLAQSGDWTASQKISLTTGGDLNPRPFEISIKVPRETAPRTQINAYRAALHAILQHYRAVISHAQHI
ncbi:MAG: hypothetical protein PHD76_06960 [Methylacidiphilales bacterium]|nr:hypothetical protein [Candidatus Methylacidiphilales bacterium]